MTQTLGCGSKTRHIVYSAGWPQRRTEFIPFGAARERNEFRSTRRILMLWRYATLAAALSVAAAGLLAAPDDKPKPADIKGLPNLVPNGDFEKGTNSPEGWQ